MEMTNEKTLDVLRDLIETCKDGQNGFRTAAEDAKDPELARVLTEFSAQRTTFIGELQDRVRSLGGDPDKSGSVSASLHRGWIDLKTAMTSNEPHAVLAECERGEDAAVKAYREALNENLDAITRGLVSRQYAAIQAAHDRIKQLRDSIAYSSKS
ncbi:aldehyde dehydrogenase [Opitutaceae bacterium EW11]|nr:aldehyde dehydrogenase [Opitutaceae bacterium EW11]